MRIECVSSVVCSSDLGMDLRGFHLFNVGLVGRAEVGLVTEGVPNRDSVATKLARHEFVVQKSAGDSVGVDFMRDLNRRGARALQGLNSNVIPLKPTNVETNVYVIPPTEKPQLGPHDVIAVIDDALMRESSTKKLIKHVSNGGYFPPVARPVLCARRSEERRVGKACVRT